MFVITVLKFSCGAGSWHCFLYLSRTDLEASQNTECLYLINTHILYIFPKQDQVWFCVFVQKLSWFEQKNVLFLRPSSNLGEEMRVRTCWESVLRLETFHKHCRGSQLKWSFFSLKKRTVTMFSFKYKFCSMQLGKDHLKFNSDSLHWSWLPFSNYCLFSSMLVLQW